jgi:hypothetical protein
MPALSFQNSNAPVTQANRLPIAGISQAAHKTTLFSIASLSTTVHFAFQHIENLPLFYFLPADSPWHTQLVSLFAAIYQLITVVSIITASDLFSINIKLDKIESLISNLNNKVQPYTQAIYI